MRFRYSTDDKGKPVKKAVVYTSDEHGIDLSNVDPQAVFIVERLRANGYETYIVGGAVRDLILHKKPKDFDIVSAASPARIKRVFRSARIIGNRFRLVHVYFNNKIFEVSTFRSIKDGPTGNTFGTIEDDVLRRDFSLNALFYDPGKQVVVDFVGGMKDIRAKKIRPIIPLAQIFTDDPVRMIRAVKYGAVTGFKLPLSLRMKIRRQAPLLSPVSPSRLTEEIFKIINSSQAGRIIEDLDNIGLYQYLQPQAAALFRTKPGFRVQYLATMAEPGREEMKNQPGGTLACLIRDYLEETADWKGNDEFQATPLAERYREAFLAARRFVLPMNPPRIELDHAVRLLFAGHGVVVKKGRTHDKAHRENKPQKEAVKPLPKNRPEVSANAGPVSDAEDAAKKSASRRRRRRRNSSRSKTVTE